MAFQTVFKRYELKYILTKGQKEKVLAAMEPYMKLDKYGRTTIRNIYFDTDSLLSLRDLTTRGCLMIYLPNIQVPASL